MYRIKIFYSLVFIAFMMVFHACSSIPKANLAIGQLSLGNPYQAWQMISKELKNPTVSSQEDLCELHLAAIQILENIISFEFAPRDADQIAKQSYDYVCSHCGAFKEKIIIAENQYGLFFLNTKRPGLALPHFKQSLKLSQKGSFLYMCNESNVATTYADMGKFELRDYYRQRSIGTGRVYFKKRRTYKYNMTEFNEFDSYKNILQLRLDELSWGDHKPEHLHEMYQIWNEIEGINKKWYSKPTQYIAYYLALQRFASAGDTAFARKLLAAAKELVEKYPYSNPDAARLDLQSAEAKILGIEGRPKDSAVLYKDWIQRFQKVSGKALSGNDYRLAGLAQESAQEYQPAVAYLEKSVKAFESVRSSFEVKSRGQVLSGLIVQSYWGLIRSYAYLYLKDKSEKDFQGALKAARMLRARQFGELINLGNSIENEIDLSLLKLRTDELLLNIVLTDRAIVMFAMSSSNHNLFIIPYEMNAFDSMVKKAKAELLDATHSKAFMDDLQAISKIIFTPIQKHMNGIQKLIVIPDGSLNGIPFTLLSKRSNQYYPLILDHEIVYTPSISYLMKQKNSEYRSGFHNILTVADPTFRSPKVPESYNDETIHFYKRAVEDFNLFVPLPETRREAENIASLFQSSEVETLYGQEATESNLKSRTLTSYRYLHMATHGVLGNQIPGVDEPALVLAVEREGSREDGFPTLGEVEDLKMNCELTVLSACDTGSGEYFTGEGVMGLSRGFLVAGSRSVIVSLWPVASEETVELMTTFYHLLRSGKSKAESLRLAQLALLEGKRSEISVNRGIRITGGKPSEKHNMHPYFWAPFVLIGE